MADMEALLDCDIHMVRKIPYHVNRGITSCTFVSMIEADFTLEILLEPRSQLHQELPQQLSPNHRQFLSGLIRPQPDCSLLRCPYADPLPALRWKLANLATFQKRCPQDLATQAMRLIPGCFRVYSGPQI
jgi:hypothetical protein